MTRNLNQLQKEMQKKNQKNKSKKMTMRNRSLRKSRRMSMLEVPSLMRRTQKSMKNMLKKLPSKK